MDCADRHDLILLYAAGVLEPAEAAELRAHLASGCPRCAGALAEAQATLALLPLQLDPHKTPDGLKQSILSRARSEPSAVDSLPMRLANWDRIILPAAIAAVLAVAATLFVVRQFLPGDVHSAADIRTISDLQTRLLIAQTNLSDVQKSLSGMKFAELTGNLQPSAVGHVFLDTNMKNWYFFTCGMKPAPDGKTYELWLIQNNQKIPAGTFDVSQNGTATLLGSIPPLSASSTVTLAVTDEPATGPHQVPTGQLQIKGNVE